MNYPRRSCVRRGHVRSRADGRSPSCAINELAAGSRRQSGTGSRRPMMRRWCAPSPPNRAATLKPIKFTASSSVRNPRANRAGATDGLRNRDADHQAIDGAYLTLESDRSGGIRPASRVSMRVFARCGRFHSVGYCRALTVQRVHSRRNPGIGGHHARHRPRCPDHSMPSRARYRQPFLLHYNFPPYSVGEIGQIGSPKLSEIGHGRLAKRGVQAVMPKPENFPYTVRVGRKSPNPTVPVRWSRSAAPVCR